MKYILGAYSQLPFGSPEEDYEALLSKQLKPLLTLMYQNPTYRLLLRLGSNVFEYLEQKYPEINMLINDLSRKNQLEMLTSSYYDTFINLVPAPERFPQIEKTTTYIRKHFAKKPNAKITALKIKFQKPLDVIYARMDKRNKETLALKKNAGKLSKQDEELTKLLSGQKLH